LREAPVFRVEWDMRMLRKVPWRTGSGKSLNGGGADLFVGSPMGRHHKKLCPGWGSYSGTKRTSGKNTTDCSQGGGEEPLPVHSNRAGTKETEGRVNGKRNERNPMSGRESEAGTVPFVENVPFGIEGVGRESIPRQGKIFPEPLLELNNRVAAWNTSRGLGVSQNHRSS